MSLNLPAVIGTYFEGANGLNADVLLPCFTPEAVVNDEERRHIRHAAIRVWMEESFTLYRPVHNLRASKQDGPVVSVVSTVSGDFPGSPVDLLHKFTLEGDLIVRLAITLA